MYLTFSVSLCENQDVKTNLFLLPTILAVGSRDGTKCSLTQGTGGPWPVCPRTVPTQDSQAPSRDDQLAYPHAWVKGLQS